MVKKIIYITANTFFGGGERVFLQLASLIDRNEFEPVFVCEDNEPLSSALSSAGVRLIPADFSSQFGLRTFLRLVKIFRRESPAVIHSQGGRVTFYVRIASLFAWPRALKPVIITTTAAPVEEYDVPGFKKLIYSFLDRLTERIDGHLITVTTSIKNTLAARHGIAPEKISVIYNGVETAAFNPEKTGGEDFRKELGISPSTKLVCSIGRLSNVKGYDYLLLSAKTLFDENPGIGLKYVIAGEGKLRKHIEDRIRDLNLDGKVLLLGHRTDTANILAASDIFVLSSLREGFPMSLLEAMAMRKAAVTTDFEGINEILADGIEGLVVPRENSGALKEAVLRLLKNPGEAGKIASNAFKKASGRFTIEKTVAGHAELYRRLISARTAAIRKILIINVSGIGDFIESISAIRNIRRTYANAKATLLVSSKAYDYAKECSVADEVLAFPVHKSRGFPVPGFKAVKGIFTLLRGLRKKNFDIAVNLYEISSFSGYLRMNLLFKAVNPGFSAGRITSGLGNFFDTGVADELTGAHNNFYYYNELASKIGAEPYEEENKLYYDPGDRKVNGLLDEWGISGEDKIIILNPGSDRLTRRWPAMNFSKTADSLIEAYNAKIIVIGSRNEAPLADEILKAAKNKGYSAAGLLNFKEVVCLISKAKLTVTTNSAAMHVSGILGVPFVAIAVSGDPVRDMPQGDPHKMVMLHQKIECNPCSYWDCPKTDYMKCMKLITPEEVISNCEKFIN